MDSQENNKLSQENNKLSCEENLSYQKIEDLTKKQTKPIIVLIIIILIVSFLYTNIPRVMNTNFHDINPNDLNSITINYHYYSNDLNEYVYENVTVEQGSENFNGIVDTFSKYDYDVTLKTFFGVQSSFSTSGNMMSLYINYGKKYNYVTLYENRISIDGIVYKIDLEENKRMMDEIIQLLME